MKTRVMVVVSDLHCGSEVGLSPRSFKLRKGNIVSIGDNLCQKWLADQWESSIGKVADIVGKDPCSLVINGDATEGSHHKNDKEKIAADEELHLEMAETCLRPLVDLAAGVFVVKGTECHTKDLEDRLAKRLNAESGKAKDKWLISVHGCLVDAAHHTGVTSRAYLEASTMSISMGNARLNYVRSGHLVPKVFLRGHRHCGGHFSDGAGLFCVTGAWQFLTRHGWKVVPDSIPSPTIIVLDWREKQPGELPTVHEIKSKVPQSEITFA